MTEFPNAYKWLDHIIERLFEADTRRLGTMITNLNENNCRLKGQVVFGFMHKGHRFIDPRFSSQAKALAKEKMPTLSLQLHGEVVQFDRDREKIEFDKNRIRQALMPLLQGRLTLQEVRDALPDCVVSMIPILKPLPRTLPDNTSLIAHDLTAMKAYEKTLPLMQAYSVAALIY